MTYKKLMAGGKELFFDADARKTTCRDCGETIRFAQDSTGKYYPIDQAGLQLHRCTQTGKTGLEKIILEEEANQEYLNSL